MPPTSLDQAMYDGYADDFVIGYNLALQQRQSRFRAHVSMAAPVRADGAQIVDHILPFEAHTGDSDLSDTKFTHPEIVSRWAYPTPIRVTVPVTTTDRLSMLADPSNQLTQSILAAHLRALDSQIIIPAFFRTVTAGKDKDKTIPFDDATSTIGQDVGGAGTGINRVKIDESYERFETAEVDLDEEQPRIGISPRQHRNLRNLAEVKNNDFTKLGGVIDENGRVTQFLGYVPVVSTKLRKTQIGGVTYVECPVWVPSGLVVQPWLDPSVRISERPDKNYITQLYCESRFGAIRAEEGRVQKMLCNEDAVPA